MSTELKARNMVTSYIADLSILAFRNYGEKMVTVTFFGSIGVVDVMVFTADKKMVFHLSQNVKGINAAESFYQAIKYLREIEVKND